MRAARRELAALCERITQDPEGAVKRPPAKDDGPREASLITKLVALAAKSGKAQARGDALVSGAAVFCDILPNYRLRARTAAEREQQQSKEVLALRQHEEALLAAYGSYVKAVESARAEGGALGTVATRCLGQLWLARPRFNLSDRVIRGLSASLDAGSEATRREAIGAVREGFKRDARGDATLQAVEAIHALVKAKGLKLRTAGPLLPLDGLKLVSVDPEEKSDKLAAKAILAARKKVKRKPVKPGKVSGADLKAARSSLKETAAIIDRVDRDKTARATTHEVALLLARVLDMGLGPGPRKCCAALTTEAVKRLARVAHAIDVDLVADAGRLLTAGARDDALDPGLRLHCASAALGIAGLLENGSDSTLLDDARLLDALYDAFLVCDADDALAVAVRAARDALLDPRRPADDARAAAFLRRVVTLAAHVQPDVGRVLLGLGLALVKRYPRLETLVDDLGRPRPVAAAGSRPYDPAAPTVDAANALYGGSSFDLLTLAHHFDPDIRRRAKLFLLPPAKRQLRDADDDPFRLLARLSDPTARPPFPVEPPPPDLVFSPYKRPKLSSTTRDKAPTRPAAAASSPAVLDDDDDDESSLG